MHYFDDIFTRYRPQKPMHLRRSSTSRSISHRSDWNGTDVDEDDEEDFSAIRRQNSVGYFTEDDLKKKAEIDEHVHAYVTDQLERMKTGDQASEFKDEVETEQ